MIVSNLTSANTLNQLHYELEKLENLPSTISVNKSNSKIVPFNVNLGNHSEREQLEKLLKEVEIAALDSQNARELLEHQISPALEILSTGKAFIPTRFNPAYQELSLLYEEFVNGQAATTLAIMINLDKMKLQVDALRNNGENMAKLSDDQVIYMTPYGINDNKPTLNLSAVLKFLPLMHIIVSSSFNSQEIMLHSVCLSDYLETNDFKKGHAKFNNDNPNTTWHDITIPDNCNIVLGACRDLDYSF